MKKVNKNNVINSTKDKKENLIIKKVSVSKPVVAQSKCRYSSAY
ncbi:MULTISPECIES: hypothetical protein [unclassified Gemella]|nr:MULTISPECIES: hypothetical protein [unclassified Gemella]